MKRREIISIIIIVLALGGAVIFAILAFTKTKVPSGSNNSFNVPTQSLILPEGRSLDFDELQKHNKSGRTFPYPEVDPVEVGQPLSDIIR